MVDPALVEQKARSIISDIAAFQTSQNVPDNFKRSLLAVLRAIAINRNGKLRYVAPTVPFLHCDPSKSAFCPRSTILNVVDLCPKKRSKVLPLDVGPTHLPLANIPSTLTSSNMHEPALNSLVQ